MGIFDILNNHHIFCFTFLGVKKTLQENVFGQHLVQDVVYRSLKGHVKYQPVKPLVLSFHGSTGTGKTFVSRWIANGWFRKGMNSKFVHIFSGTKDFPHASNIESYVNFLHGEISSHTRSCGHQIFIFEEVDSFPPDLLPSIRFFLEYYGSVEGVDYRNTIFLLLSNAGSEQLQRITGNVYKYNNNRESIQLAETEREMVLSIFNTKGETNRRLVDRHLISHLVPFLPLERRHVRKCIEAELTNRLIQSDSKIIDDVIAELLFEGTDNIFSSKGCKNVAEKLSFVLSDLTSTPRQDL
ncbi:Torsin-1A [Holothuria leucospilota]|uniref:Torsin-1A n=1 Tax=Holothuria leucospilota TaxID=206669 RepID=A0A9Q1CTV7_HOLLE|nr:Torsin-1A [Holothuria leucospilota]